VNSGGLFFASGESLYSGAALLLLVMLASPYSKQAWHFRLRNIFAWIGLIMIVMAVPPFPWIVDLIFLVVFLLWYAIWNWPARTRAFRIIPTAALAVLLVVLPVVEFPHRTLPTIRSAPSEHLVVIGDSISAGINPLVPPWPALMQQLTGIPVKSLAQVGATTSDGIELAAGVTPQDNLVLIEIGGNDLIANLPSSRFAQALEAILSNLAVPGRTVVMFELPLLPYKVDYGQIQRGLAAKYGVWLIPKRYFVGVISGADATSDGLHLTATGTQRMVSLVSRVLRPVLLPVPLKPGA